MRAIATVLLLVVVAAPITRFALGDGVAAAKSERHTSLERHHRTGARAPASAVEAPRVAAVVAVVLMDITDSAPARLAVPDRAIFVPPRA